MDKPRRWWWLTPSVSWQGCPFRLADIAYVGEWICRFWFLHNVVEAAVFAPLLLMPGPNFHTSQKAEQLEARKALTVIEGTQQRGKTATANHSCVMIRSSDLASSAARTSLRTI